MNLTISGILNATEYINTNSYRRESNNSPSTFSQDSDHLACKLVHFILKIIL